MPVVERTRFMVGPADGDAIYDGPIGTTIKVAGSATGGVLSICEMPIAAGYMVPPHTHRDFDEWSVVLEGRVGARVGDDEFIAVAGSYILKPRGIQHTFWNPGPEPARIIELITPAGFEEFFRRVTKLANADELTDELMESMAAEYGTTVSMDWVDDLVDRYGLTVTV
ncbi:MAG: cupin domain-containing protein [Ilumatobacteraceae bacterium]